MQLPCSWRTELSIRADRGIFQRPLTFKFIIRGYTFEDGRVMYEGSVGILAASTDGRVCEQPGENDRERSG